ncbi:MAG: CotH kinase family protein [Endozoicomonas sp.]
MPQSYPRQDATVSLETRALFPEGTNLRLVFINTFGHPLPDEPKITAELGIVGQGTWQNQPANQRIDIPPLLNRHTFETLGAYSLVGIELRGSTSLKFPKKGYGIETKNITQIETTAAGHGVEFSAFLDQLNINSGVFNATISVEDLDQDISLLGMPKEEDWVLHGPYADKTLIRNHLAYTMSRWTGAAYSPRTELVEVFLTDAQEEDKEKEYSYQGVYLWTEKVKRNKARVNIGKLKAGEDQTQGGIILSIDNIKGKTNEGFHSDYTSAGVRNVEGARGLPVEILYEDPDSGDFAKCDPDPGETCMRSKQQTYIQGTFRSFETALSNLRGDSPLSELEAVMNVPSFVDYLLFTELTRNPDGYRHSVYMYKDKDPNLSTTAPFYMGPVWDYNIAFGNSYGCNGTSSSGWQFTCTEVGDGLPIPFWWRQLTENAQFRRQMASRWQELRADGGAFSTARINAFIDQESAKLKAKGAATRNFNRWDVLGRQIPPGLHDERITTFDGEISQFKSWIGARTTWMDSNLPSADNGYMVQSVSSGTEVVAGTVTLMGALVVAAVMSIF